MDWILNITLENLWKEADEVQFNAFCRYFQEKLNKITKKNGVFWVVTTCGSCRFLQEPHGVTTQKTPFFIVTSVKTTNITR
jgi:hypothetical protein